MLYGEGNGHILQNGILSLDSPATLRNLTLNGLDCGSNVTIENCRFTRLTCRGGNASLIGVTAASEDAMLELWDTDAKIDADCTMDVLSATLSELGKGSMNIVNDGDVADRLDLTTRGGTIKLSGEGHARRLSLLDTSSYYKTKAAFKVEQDTDRLEIDVDSKTNVIYTGDVSGDIRIEDLKEGSSITLIGTVGGEVTVSFNADALGFEADGKTVEKYANACLKGLKLNKCKTAQNETPTVRLSEYYLMQISTNERSEDNLTNTVNIVDYDISYDGEKIVCSGRTHTTQRRERRGENDEWGDPVSETVVRYDAEGNVVD